MANSLTRREIIPLVTDILAKVANKDSQPLKDNADLRKRLYGDTGVMVEDHLDGDENRIGFSFFLKGKFVQPKIVAVGLNIETFNEEPRIYLLNMLRHIGEGATEAAKYDIDQRFLKK